MSDLVDVRRASTAPFTARPAHEALARFVGEWSGPTRTWLDPTKDPEPTETLASVASILGGRWIRIEYRGVCMGSDHAGEMLVGFHGDAKAYELAWVDSFHTGTSIMSSSGPARDDGTVEVLGSYGAGAERWGWRTVLRLDREELVIEAFNIAPSGEEDRAIETRLKRVRS